MTQAPETMAERAARRIEEAETEERRTQEQFAAMAMRLDGVWDVNAGDVWPAISLDPLIATALVEGRATVFPYPVILGHTGPLLVCSTATPFRPGCNHRQALGVVQVLTEGPMTPQFHGMMAEPFDVHRHRRARAILCGSPRPIEPFYVRGTPGIYRVMIPSRR